MSIKKCEHCGSTAMSFDPPIELVIGEQCGAVKPGTYTGYEPGGIPTCDSAKGHDGDHAYIVEYLDRWPHCPRCGENLGTPAHPTAPIGAMRTGLTCE